MKRDQGPPAYQRIAGDLRQLVLSSGSTRLPTEAEVVRRYEVSRHTARRAYQEVVGQGLVSRAPRRGSFAALGAQYMPSFGSIDDLIAVATETEMEVISPLRESRRLPRTVAAALGGAEGVAELAFRRFRGDLPFAFSYVWLPREVGASVARSSELLRPGARHARFSIVQLLDATLNTPIVRATQEITVVPTPSRVGEMLDISAGRDVMRIDRVFATADGTCVEVTRNYFNPDRYAYRVEIRRTR